MRSVGATLSAAWAALVLATLASFLVADGGSPRGWAIGATMALAAAKAGIVLFGFMEASRLPATLRWCVIVWTCACGGMIAGLAITAL